MGVLPRMAGRYDCDYELVCGSVIADADRNRWRAEVLGLDPGRAYATFDKWRAAEAALPADERMEALAIVTPNHLHAPMAIAALDAGFPVLSEKPMALNLAEADRKSVV